MPTVKIKRLFLILPWLLALLLGMLFVALIAHELQRQARVWEQQLAQGQQIQQHLVEASHQTLTRDARLIAGLIAGDQQLTDLIRAAYRQRQLGSPAAETQLQELRQQLAQRMALYWSSLNSSNGRQLTAYLAPRAEALFRAHDPQHFGDLSHEIRPLVMASLSRGQELNALEVGRHGAGYRSVVPVFANDGQGEVIVGALELGLGLLDARLSPNGDSAVMVNPSALRGIQWSDPGTTVLDSRSARRGQWLLDEVSGEPAHAWAAAGILPDPLNHGWQLIHWEGRDYVLYITLLRDFLGVNDARREPLVAVLNWHDISEELANYTAVRRDTWVKWLLALLLIEAALLGVLYLSGRYVKSILAAHRQHLEFERDSSEAAREQLTLALSNSDSGFWEWDFTTGSANFSPHWKKLCGIDEHTKLLPCADEWLLRIHPNDKAIARRDILLHLNGDVPMYETEYRLRTEAGDYRWFYIRGKVVEWQANGKAARMVGVYTDIHVRKQAEVTVLRQQAALRSMNEIASLPAIEPEEQLRRALTLGASYLGLPMGIISQVNSDDYRVRVQVSPPDTLNDEDRFDVKNTYCEITLKHEDVVAIDHMGESEYRGHPCYKSFQLECYIGVPLYVNGKVYGTLNYSSASPRYHAFDELDKDFIRLLGRWTGATIERWRQFDDQQELVQRFRKLSERLPGFLFQYQLHPDGSVSFPYASAGIEYIYGLRAEQARTDIDSVFTVIHPEDLERVKQSIELSAAQLSLWTISFRVNHPARGLIWVHGDSKPERLADGSTLWHGFLSDITHEKTAELKLQETNALQQAIFDAASMAIISVDTQGTIVIFNRGAELMLGYTADELIGKETPAVFHLRSEITARAEELTKELGYDVEDGFGAFIALARQDVIDEREWTYVRKDGVHLTVLLAVSALYDADGQSSGFVGIARDITELKRIEQMKNEFVATVSHELRTPLTSIKGSLALVLNGATGKLPNATEKMLQIAHKNSERLTHLVNDLLDMEKLIAGKIHFELRKQLLRPLLEQALVVNSIYAEQYRVDYELNWKLPQLMVNVDEHRLAQVLANYLSNAAKFSMPGDTVVISAEQIENRVCVRVTDTGIGIPPEFHAQIFQKFFQVDSSDARQKSGTGLGLAICKGLIEKMNGSVGFESELGRGSSFYFTLPCIDHPDYGVEG